MAEAAISRETADMDATDHMDNLRLAGHTVATTATVGMVFGWLPTLLTVLTGILVCVWYSIAIWESKTVRNLVKRLRGQHDLPPTP